MKEIATENFQRICEAYEILSDENKRQIYDIYGMEGIMSGLELGPKLNKVEELKEELERIRRMKEQEKTLAHLRPSGMMLASLSLPQFLEGDGIMGGYCFFFFLSLISSYYLFRISFHVLFIYLKFLGAYLFRCSLFLKPELQNGDV